MLKDPSNLFFDMSDSRPRILILTDEADDDDALLLDALRCHAMVVDRVHTTDDFNTCVGQVDYDLVLIDLFMRKTDSLRIVKRLGAFQNLPGIMVRSEIDDDIDKIILFELGADDFVLKYSSPREVTARIRAVLRRRLSERKRHDQSFEGCICGASQHKLVFAEWVLYSKNRQLETPEGGVLKLSIIEYSILSRFFNEPDTVIARSSLVSTSDEGPDLRSVDIHVSRLRKKLALHGGQDLIQTVRGQGYKMVAPASAKRR